MSTTPGPGEYSPAHLSKKLKISFKTKLKPIEDTNVKSPGPGSCIINLIQIIFQNWSMKRENVFFLMFEVALYHLLDHQEVNLEAYKKVVFLVLVITKLNKIWVQEETTLMQKWRILKQDILVKQFERGLKRVSTNQLDQEATIIILNLDVDDLFNILIFLKGFYNIFVC